MKASAVEGLDFIRDENWRPKLRTRKGWELYARREAAKKKPKGLWHGCVAWIEHRQAYRISYGGQRK